MIRLFFPKIKESINSINSTEKNREILAEYFNQNILLWMFWSLFFMDYVNCKEIFFLTKLETIDVVIASCLQYIFLFQILLAIGLVKILKLTEEEADALCKAIRGDKYRE